MASNQRRLIRRTPIINKQGKPAWEFGIWEATSFGARRLVAIIEGTRLDAELLLKAPRTESGNTFRGFRKLKTP